MRAFVLLALSILISSTDSVYAQGYLLREDGILVESAEHWREWIFPSDVVEIDAEGVHPRFFEEEINACRNLAELGGTIRAGTDVENVWRIVDGDATTFWEPAIEEPLKNWWIEIDLGRIVVAQRLVIRFMEEELGDPFLRFKAETSPGLSPGLRELPWYTVYGSGSSGTPSECTVDVELAMRAWSGGQSVKLIRIQVLGSRLDRGKELPFEEYQQLAPELQGRTDHYQILPDGKEMQIDREGYETLPPTQRGAIRYYRREMSRLAEVEVWSSLGENVGPGTLARGGSVWLARGEGGFAWRIVDGQPETELSVRAVDPAEGNEGVFVDLGATFWVDAIIPLGNSPMHGPDSYRIRGSDGSQDPDGSLHWNVLASRGESIWFEFTVDRFRPTKLRFVNFQYVPGEGAAFGEAELVDLLIYAHGYPPEVALTSPVVELDTTQALTAIRWEGGTPSGTRVELRTRTGDALDEKKHYYDASGVEVTEERYAKLPGFARGPVTVQLVPGRDWSSWSYPYAYPGAQITSPTPCRYLQIGARLLSEDPERAATLRSIAISSAPTLAHALVAEITPRSLELQGTPTRFRLYIRPVLESADLGFDEIAIHPSVPVELREIEVYGGAAELRDSWSLPFEIVSSSPDVTRLRLSTPILFDGPKVLEIAFDATLFLSGTRFDVSVSNTDVLGASQQAESGDAVGSVESEKLRISIPVERRVIGRIQMEPNPFTPNGDGIHDKVDVCFDVFNLYTQRDVRVEVYDLMGHRIRRMWERRSVAAGTYRFVWDGRDESGVRVAPGVYVCRIEVDVDDPNAEGVQVCRTICVTY